MKTTAYPRGGPNRKRGVVAVQVGVMMVALLGFAALTVDVSTLMNVRGDLQRTADSAALAGASAYVSDEMMMIRQGVGGEGAVYEVQSMATSRVHGFANMNASFGKGGTKVSPDDIAMGWINVHSATEKLVTGGAVADFNGVQVMVRREADGDAGNGPVDLFFAPIFGRFVAETSASAVAVFDDRVRGFDPDAPNGNLAPFTVHRDAYYQDFYNGEDQFSYHEASNSVDSSPDGVNEVRIYPYPLSGSGYDEGSGNFGMLNVGIGGQGASAEEEQILDGVTADQLEAEIGTPYADFYDDAGNEITHDITGSPGLTASHQSALTLKVGDIIGFFLHTAVVDNGSNIVYTITEIRFGRVMDVFLHGPPHRRGVYIQPVPFVGDGIRIDPEAPSTNGELGRLVLAR